MGLDTPHEGQFIKVRRPFGFSGQHGVSRYHPCPLSFVLAKRCHLLTTLSYRASKPGLSELDPSTPPARLCVATISRYR